MTALRVLLANEAGGGRGHVALLTAAARALGSRAVCVAALGRLLHAGDLAALCDRVVAAPLLARPRAAPQTFALPGSATWGDVLAEIGLADPAKLRRGLRFWRELIVAEDISLLIADFAPLALRAALGLREEGWAIRIVSLGTGYTAPPAGLANFPLYLADHDRITHAEPATLAQLNAAGAAMGWSPLPRLSALYDVDLSLAATLPALDPYRDLRPSSGRLAPLVPAATCLAGSGDGVFVYFSTRAATDPGLVAALAALPLPRRGYLPRLEEDDAARLTGTGMKLLDAPASADEIARSSRLILHAAPHGTLCLAALAGLPQFAIPQHLEQLFNARQGESLGILHQAQPGRADLETAILAAYHDDDLARQARDQALALRQTHPVDPIAVLADRLAPEIEAAAAAL